MTGFFNGGGGGGNKLIGSVTASGASGVQFLALPAGVPLILTYWDVFNATGGENINLRVSADNGATFESSANYGYSFRNCAGSLAVSNGSTEIPLTDDMALNVVNRIAGRCVMFPAQGGQDRSSFVFRSYQGDASSNYRGSSGYGVGANVGGPVDAIRIFASAGNLSGEFRLHQVKV